MKATEVKTYVIVLQRRAPPRAPSSDLQFDGGKDFDAAVKCAAEQADETYFTQVVALSERVVWDSRAILGRTGGD